MNTSRLPASFEPPTAQNDTDPQPPATNDYTHGTGTDPQAIPRGGTAVRSTTATLKSTQRSASVLVSAPSYTLNPTAQYGVMRDLTRSRTGV
ncbi:hypothetical protein SARC_06184 [Sphaeroforma arctica JP610]|uniref:Uncharacterized protein n=1 Tax=Sphaeroforma arctica JP610 TaxID=667725 RepID=A0A0L0FY55_9EUKA|nr:hypothetical protein SARC_06184 [Sphaeroforma arctica JP610]KNC81496.1 hypothetical protein SARC_06184 [Sphaeroforma arctica JP610]|eukprot:XP_014155398.1 hypothetical protein SARC_06184 [Sphaeroforma arctica JP610]